MKMTNGQALTNTSFGASLRRESRHRTMMCFIGIYDVFSATIAAKYFDGLFLSGFSFAASHYGLPDVGFIAWPDMVGLCQRVRAVLPGHHLVVDIDDGYGDADVAGQVVARMESVGASAVVLEDQRRPRRCGHVEGKQILDLDEYLVKLRRVLSIRKELFVIARTDATENEERVRRAVAFDEAGADAILVDGLEDLAILQDLSKRIRKPLMFNQISGGKSPPCTLAELSSLGVSLVNYSTPCLFASMSAIERSMIRLRETDGMLSPDDFDSVGVTDCNETLRTNLVVGTGDVPHFS